MTQACTHFRYTSTRTIPLLKTCIHAYQLIILITSHRHDSTHTHTHTQISFLKTCIITLPYTNQASDIAPAWLARECTDAISLLGCSHLPSTSTCMRFCGASSMDTDVSTAQKSSSDSAHDVFVKKSYVDTVYGTPYSSAVDKTDYVTAHNQRVSHICKSVAKK